MLLPRPATRAAAPGTTSLVHLLGGSTATLQAEAGTAAAIEGETPVDAFGTAQQAMRAGAAEDRFRQTVRQEQEGIYQLAGNPSLAAQVEAQLGPRTPAGLSQVLAALQALWTLTGQTRPAPLFERPWNAALPVSTLQAYYEQAAATEGLSWPYLAAINYVESDFGRNTDDSPAGAEGPMQFLPSTWALYGEGGDIHDPQDAITTAARYLHAMGAPGNYPLAIQRYNDDANYVAAVTALAAAVTDDTLWLQRLYYWSTYG